MAADVEAQPREVELSALEAEKQPMAGGEAKNGLVKAAQGPGDESGAGPKFTGLGKEELLRAAASPAWARARTALLALFWLGWLAMLAAAAVIVARAPRCQAPLGAAWWKLGVLYRAPPEAFGGDLKGVQARLGHVAELGAGGLLLGPLHPPPEGGDPRAPPRLGELDPALGTEEELGGLLRAAREKGVQVVVELTPDPKGEAPWGSPEMAAEPQFQQGLKDAVGRWLQRGVGGVFLDGIEGLQPSLVQELQNITEQHSSDGTPRLFLGGTRLQDPPALLQLLRGWGGLPLLLGPFLQSLGGGLDPPGPNASRTLIDYARAGPPLAWSLGTPWQRLPWLRPPLAPQLLLLLLGGLPGSPLLNHGDQTGQLTPMPWDVVEAAREGGNSTEPRLHGNPAVPPEVPPLPPEVPLLDAQIALPAAGGTRLLPEAELRRTGSGSSAMKLLTHNLLTSHVRGLRPGTGFPLLIRASQVRVRSVPFSAAFVARLLPRLRWAELLQAAESLGHPPELPPEPAPGAEADEDFLRRLHHVLLEVEVLEGELQCPESGRRFPIAGGVPNLLLPDHEA